MESMTPVAKFNVLFLGDSSVGKTSIITRFMHDRFNPAYEATQGVDRSSKTIHLVDTSLRLTLWDTTENVRYQALIQDSSVAVIVYDVAKRKSFLSALKLVENIVRRDRDDVITFLVGNKTDLVDKRQVSTEEGGDKASDFGVIFMETSAESGFNIKPLFRKISAALPERLAMNQFVSRGAASE